MKLISGGQTGVDRATLDVGLELGIPIGGWCPKGRRAEDGRIPDKYPLIETHEEDYMVRTRMNIIVADTTLIIVQSMKEVTGGTLATKNYCEIVGKVWGVLDLGGRLAYDKPFVRNAILRASVLNVAGPRESKSPGIYEATKKFLLEVFKK